MSLVEPPRAPDLAPQRERPPELDPDLRPRLSTPARLQHHAQDAVDAEPGGARGGRRCRSLRHRYARVLRLRETVVLDPVSATSGVEQHFVGIERPIFLHLRFALRFRLGLWLDPPQPRVVRLRIVCGDEASPKHPRVLSGAVAAEVSRENAMSNGLRGSRM